MPNLNDRLRALIESGHYDEAVALLVPAAPVRKSRFELAEDDPTTVWDVDEREVTHLIVQRMARWGVEFAGALDAHVASVLNKLRGRVD